MLSFLSLLFHKKLQFSSEVVLYLYLKRFYTLAFYTLKKNWNRIITTPAPHITVILKTIKSAITHCINLLQPLNFTTRMVRKNFVGAGVKTGQWAWHRPPIDKVLYLRTHFSKFSMWGYPNITIMWKGAKITAATSNITKF